MAKVLIGNSFPLSLIRRGVTIEQVDLETFKQAYQGATVYSFWGHENTRSAAEMVLGVNLKPRVERPVIALSEEGVPRLEGTSFHTCYVLSPDYRAAFRPKIGEEVAPEQIAAWHLLQISWTKDVKEEGVQHA